MFNAHGMLHLEADHLDLSFGRSDAWPVLTPGGSLKVHTFEVGDAEAGPTFQLVIVDHRLGETLDWKHSVDPVHHHGSDQFRIVAQGSWTVAGRSIPVSGYNFHEAGWVYQEHPDPEPVIWMALMSADRRGLEATLRFAKDQETVIKVDKMYGVPDGTSTTYPHPAGRDGIAAIATTQGPCERGYLFGDAAQSNETGAVISGLLGDPLVGPLVHVIHSEAGEEVFPAVRYDTELVFIVSRGSCTIGEKVYEAGDMRIQREGADFPGLVAGTDGVEAALVVADRRAAMHTDEQIPIWMDVTGELLAEVAPRPGGARGLKAAGA